ncbi:MAG: GGDEF domain-containing protein, partial [Candidatus Cloacimonetes bacterium]|nr:GGDEF domain-containing protein [Candidatus Cloacimonadota bacterium]
MSDTLLLSESMSNNEKKLMLAGVSVFAEYSKQITHEFIEQYVTHVTFPPNANMISKADTEFDIYLIIQGTVQVFRCLDNNQTADYGTRVSGHLVGEYALVAGEKRTAEVRTLTKVKALRISEAGFRFMLVNFPRLKERILDDFTGAFFGREDNKDIDDVRGDVFSRLYSELREQKEDLEMLNTQLRRTNHELQSKNDLLYQMAIHDQLTSIYNRRFIIEMFGKELERHQRYGINLTCIILDIDDFKLVNDNYGHLAGDEVLINIAALIGKSLRNIDIYGRYGGEEFLVILPNVTINSANVVTERIRKTISDTSTPWRQHKINVTVSIGMIDTLHNKTDTIDD